MIEYGALLLELRALFVDCGALLMSATQRHRNAYGTQRHRDSDTHTGHRHRHTQTDTQRRTETYIDTERYRVDGVYVLTYTERRHRHTHTDTQRHTEERHRDTQR